MTLNNCKTNIQQSARAETLFANPLANDATIAHNIAGWLRAVELLGDRWILANANKIERKL